jgi:5'-nucleotidase
VVILVTNDDGLESPALVPLLRALAGVATLRVVVPKGERSWISKAISRWQDVRVERLDREGFDVFVVDGFPADCANLGIHTLYDDPPGLVVSGINLGLNTGLGWFLSSGTVGAASEARIARIPALAFSIGVAGDDRTWKRDPERVSSPEVWRRASALVADVVRTVCDAGFPPGTDLLNVNFPVGAGPETRRVVTRVAPVGYAGLFRRKEEGVFVHDYDGALLHEAETAARDATTDMDALGRGWVSITPVRLADAAEISDEVRRRLEGSDRSEVGRGRKIARNLRR